MKTLNLSEGFNPLNSSEEDTIKFEKFNFSGGEPHIKLDVDSLYMKPHPFESVITDEVKRAKINFVTITHRVNSPTEMVEVLLAADALIRQGIYFIDLFMPYFPGARQDSIMVEGEPLTVKVYADLINNSPIRHVTTLDPHSDVTAASLDSPKVIPNHNFVYNVLHDISKIRSASDIPKWGKESIIISPDAGSNKKITKLSTSLGGLTVVKCDKNRDRATGKLLGFEVYTDDLKGRNCIIVDDICANGGTFMGLAEKLKEKNAGDLYLVITHGEFGTDKVKTLSNLSKVFKKIYTTDSIFDIDDSWLEATHHYKNIDLSESITQIKIQDFL